MKILGKIKDLRVDFFSKKTTFTVETRTDAAEIEGLLKAEALDIEMKKHREKRSLDANACLWWCIDKISKALRADPWDVYLLMLNRYGVFTSLRVREDALPVLKREWRDISITDRFEDEYGAVWLDVNAYLGSSHYDSKEFSYLLDGIISEMKEMRIETPIEEDVRAIVQDMEKRERRKRDKADRPA